MTEFPHVLRAPSIPGRGSSLNAFAIVVDAAGFIDFASSVFDATEIAAARTVTPSGLLIHAELELGDSLLLLSDPQEGWPERPGLFQLWVSDVEDILNRAGEHDATVVTPPTPFYGGVTLVRLQDRWGNLWWLYQPVPGQADPVPVWEGGSDIIFRTLDEHMRGSAN